MLMKIACNTTNSAAITHKGDVFVWGSGKTYSAHGLLGNPRQKMPVHKPTPLNLSRNHKVYYAKDIAFGEYHGVVLLDDNTTKNEFVPFVHAKAIFEEIKNDLMKKIMVKDQAYNLLKSNERSIYEEIMTNENGTSDRYNKMHDVLCARLLKNIFKTKGAKERGYFPFASVGKFKEVVFNVLNMPQTTENLRALDTIISDMQDPKTKHINIREFRDQIVGFRCSNGKVMAWGVKNRGRLGAVKEEKEAMEEECEEESKVNKSSEMSVESENIENEEDDNDENLIPVAPIKVRFDVFPAITEIVKVSCGQSHTLALTNEGTVYSWGLDVQGCLGLGSGATEKCTPTRIKTTKNNMAFNGIRDIACGASHSLASTVRHRVFSWGNGKGGRLGHGDEKGEMRPKEIMWFPINEVHAAIIAAGDSHSACISETQDLYTWGMGSHGKLGHAYDLNEVSPRIVVDLKQKRVEAVACGAFHTMCLAQGGKLFSWGDGKNGRLGIETGTETNVMAPRLLSNTMKKMKLTQIAAGSYHSMALSCVGEVLTCGNYREGKLGYEAFKDVYQPTIIPEFVGFKEKTIDKKKEEAETYSEYDTTFKRQPKQKYTKSVEIVQIKCNNYNTFFLTNSGELYVCGNGDYGQLTIDPDMDNMASKDGEDAGGAISQSGQSEAAAFVPKGLLEKLKFFKKSLEISEPILIPRFSGEGSIMVKYLSCGAQHAIVLSNSGQAYSWGRNTEGQLGIGRMGKNYINIPTQIKALEDKHCKMSACSDTHSLMLTEAGDVYAFGLNENGKLGFEMSSVGANHDEKDTMLQQEAKIEQQPRVVPGLKSINYIACGPNHSLAISGDKTKGHSMQIFTWGSGYEGKLGHGDFENQYSPKIIELENKRVALFMMAECGASHTLALDSKGKLWYWGSKRSRGIDDSNVDLEQAIPRIIPELAQYTFKFIAAGQNHNMAISTSGEIIGFGSNDFAKISLQGGKYLTDKKIVLVKPTVMAAYVACGQSHSAAIDEQGLPYTWGNLYNGRCGFDTNVFNGYELSKEKSGVEPTMVNTIGDKLKDEKQRIELLIKDQNVQFQGYEVSKKNEDGNDEVLKFAIQKELQENSVNLHEINLVNRNLSLELEFYTVLNEYMKTVTAMEHKRKDALYKAENAIISRVFTFPSKVPLLNDIKNTLPKIVVRNKQIFELLISILQMHPCYLINIFNLPGLDKLTFIKIVNGVYGKNEIYGNLRLLHLLMILSRNVLKLEMKKVDFDEFISEIENRVYSELFQMVFKSQPENIRFIDVLISFVYTKMAHDYTHYAEDFKNEKKKKQEGKALKDEEEKRETNLMFDYLANKDMSEAMAKKRCENLIAFIEAVMKKITKILDVRKHKDRVDESSMLSPEVFWMLETFDTQVRNKINGPVDSEDHKEIESTKTANSKKLVYYNKRKISAILTLLLREFAKRLEMVNKDPVKRTKHTDAIKEFASSPSRDRDNMISNIDKFAKVFYNYIQENTSLDNPIPAIINYLSSDTNGKKTELCDLLLNKHVKLDLMLIRDVLHHAAEIEPPTVCINLDSLILIYNTSVKNCDSIFVDEPSNDPLGIKAEKMEAGMAKMSRVRIEEAKDVFDPLRGILAELDYIVIDEQQIVSGTKKYDLNLTLLTKSLVNSKNLVKCPCCGALVNEVLVGEKSVKLTMDDINWQCEHCHATNKVHSMICSRCSEYRDNDTLSAYLLFDRYLPIHQKKVLTMFENILFILPPIPMDIDMNEILNKWGQVYLEKSESMSYEKGKIIEQFINYKNAMIEKKNDKGKEFIESRFYTDLDTWLNENYNNRKEFTAYMEQIENLVIYIKERVRFVEQINSLTMKELQCAQDNAFAVMGNASLKEFHKFNIKSGMMHKKIKPTNSKLKKFLDVLNAQQDNQSAELYARHELNEMTKQRKYLMKSFMCFGKYPSYFLKSKKILNSISYNNRKIPKIIKKCSFIFNDNGDYGYNVQLVFEEAYQNIFLCGQAKKHEVVLESFEIAKEKVAEMRRTRSTKTTTTFKSSEFNIFEFVHFLNLIRSKSFTYSNEEQ